MCQELIVQALILHTIHHTHIFIIDSLDIAKLSRIFAKSLPFAATPVEVRLKDVNYIATRNKPSGFIRSSQLTVGTKVSLCDALSSPFLASINI